MTTITIGIAYVEETCIYRGCGISFALNKDHYRRLHAKPGTPFYCPNGHEMVYTGTSDEQKLKDAEARELALKDQLSASLREAEATRIAMLRDRARFAAGVCICCNRSFENVRRHMATQHPEFNVDELGHAPVFACSCGRKFDSYRGLRIHQGSQRQHTGPRAWDNPKTSRWAAHLTEVKS